MQTVVCYTMNQLWYFRQTRNVLFGYLSTSHYITLSMTGIKTILDEKINCFNDTILFFWYLDKLLQFLNIFLPFTACVTVGDHPHHRTWSGRGIGNRGWKTVKKGEIHQQRPSTVSNTNTIFPTQGCASKIFYYLLYLTGLVCHCTSYMRTQDTLSCLG